MVAERGLTVKDLKNLLKDQPDDLEVVVAHDAEGNGFSPLYEVSKEKAENLDQIPRRMRTVPPAGTVLVIWPA